MGDSSHCTWDTWNTYLRDEDAATFSLSALPIQIHPSVSHTGRTSNEQQDRLIPTPITSE